MAGRFKSSELRQVSLIFACGTAMFSDGYSNGSSDVVVNTLLPRIYGNQLNDHNYGTVLPSAAFAGTIVGMLVFGLLSDKIGRKFGKMTATGIVAFFSGLSAASSGTHGSLSEILAMLIACRFLLGIGVGAECPCGSVAASEQSEDEAIAKNAQHRWFALATNCVADVGFVVSSFVPLVLYWIFGPNHLGAVWRLSLGLGVIPALAVFIWRVNMEEPERFRRDSMKNVETPYWLIIKRYWVELLAMEWGGRLYSTPVVNNITGGNDSLSVIFTWGIVINAFYLPGAILGSFIIDAIGPKQTMIFGLVAQAIIGFIMSAPHAKLTEHIAAFAVIYGLFLSLGEVGPGNNLGLLASKSGPTAVHGQYYGIAAAVGKVGAFVGTWAFPPIIDAFGGDTTTRENTGPFWIGSGLALLSAAITLFFVKPLTADGMVKEDEEFRAYLEAHGYDTSRMGIPSETTTAVDHDVAMGDDKGSV